MPVVVDPEAKTIIISSDLIQLSGTDPVEIYRALPEKAKFVLTKLHIYNKDSADHDVILGSATVDPTTGALTWVKDKFITKVNAGSVVVFDEKDLPADYVMTSNSAEAIYSWAGKLDAAVSANNVYVKAEFKLL